LLAPTYSRIIITRPRDQNIKLKIKLSTALFDNGIDLPIDSIPLLEIVPIFDQALASSLWSALRTADWVTFVSPNAFLKSDQLLKAFGFQWPLGLSIAVVGGGSEQSIIESGIEYRRIVKPQDAGMWDSEGLWTALQTVQQDWNGTRVVMVHGDGGRAFLSDHLKTAGAMIEEFAVYQRQALAVTDPAWQHLLEQYQIDPHLRSLWMFSSSQAGQALHKGMKQLQLSQGLLSQSTAIVSHERIQEKVSELGFGQVQMILPGDDELIKTIIDTLKKGI
jgi:uroporphyrinogen-III synthase